MSELEELGRKLLDESEGGLLSAGGGIRKVDCTDSFVIQCTINTDNGVYPSLEEATLRWIQLRIEGKI